MNMRCATAVTKVAVTSLLGLGLVACQTTNTTQSSPQSPVENRFPATKVSDPGIVQFKINPSGVGAYYGWQMQLTKAARNKGFKPFTTERLSAGQLKEYTLWPDSYAVNVYRLGNLRYSGWIEVHPSETTVVYADYGLLSDNIVIRREPDPFRAHPELDTTAWRAPISTSYGAEVLFEQHGYRAEYSGPKNNGHLVGEGTIRITRGGLPFAEIVNAKIADKYITGAIKYADGREVDGDNLTIRFQLSPGSTTRWPDGTVFTGTYQAFDPMDGKLQMANGNVWQGSVRARKPSGQGRLTWWEGGWMELPEGSVFPNQTGKFMCGSEAVPIGDCYYYSGKKLSGPDELAALIERDRKIAAQAAAQKNEKDTKQSVSNTSNQQAAAQGGCRNASGTFRDKTGNSTLRLDSPGQGRGNFVSYTYGGLDKYRFEVDFTFTTTSDSISVTYGNGVYSDATTGRVLQRMSAPSATVACSYDGAVLVYGGEEYRH